ncbi:MAG: extracellular solute-binding protein [Zoogloeaceae bacterium]|nr:extracellular solute-binding protein [Zoogloeaceae bacterium]
MKSIRNFTQALTLVGACLLVSTPIVQAKTPRPAAKSPPPTERCDGIEFTQALGQYNGAALGELVSRFNETNKTCPIQITDRTWSDGKLPGMMILSEGDEEKFLAGPPRYRPLHEVMKTAGQPLVTLRPPTMMTPMPLDAQGRLRALPVALSTPILYINQEAFRRVGLNSDQPPQTWFDLQQALGQLIDNGVRCPYTVAEPSRVMIENTSAWHNEPTVTRRGKSDGLSINGMLQIKHVALMASWVRSNYLHIFGRGAEAQQHFTSGECAVIAASSASLPEIRRTARFPVAVAGLPYHDDYPGAPQNTLLDGSSLWIAAGRSPAEYKTIAKFVRFWLEPENQVAWQKQTGFLPLNRAGIAAARESELLKDELDGVRVAIAQVAHKPPTAASSSNLLIAKTSVREIVEEELEAVWADRKPAKEALDTAVTRASALP